MASVMDTDIKEKCLAFDHGRWIKHMIPGIWLPEHPTHVFRANKWSGSLGKIFQYVETDIWNSNPDVNADAINFRLAEPWEVMDHLYREYIVRLGNHKKIMPVRHDKYLIAPTNRSSMTYDVATDVLWWRLNANISHRLYSGNFWCKFGEPGYLH
jgi:hypothetical protein